MSRVNRQSGYEIALVQNIGLLKENGYLRRLLHDVGEKTDIGEVNDFINREWEREFDGAFARGAPENTEQKAHKTWQDYLETIPEESYFQNLKPHGGKPGPVRILLIAGGGGIGDALMYTPFLAELKKKFSPCEIAYFFMMPVIKDLCLGNELVDAVLTGDWKPNMQGLCALAELDLFDMVIYSDCFFPRYVLCKNSRLATDDLRHWILGNNAIADMLTVFKSNFGSNLLDRMLSLHYLDVLGIITGLPIRAESPLFFAPDPQAIPAVAALNLPASYVTVRDGANAYDSKVAQELGADRTNKQMPAGKWQEILAFLQREGLHAVQVGTESDTAIPDVNYDLRGKTSLSELCFVMKNAVAHIDTEGGLVHFARAVHVPAVAIHGATSPSFFGYPQNANIYSYECNSCFYADRTWIARCPRGTAGPVCTDSIPVNTIIRPVLEIRSNREAESYEILACTAAGGLSREEIAANHLARFLSAKNVPKIAFVGTPDAMSAHEAYWPEAEIDAVLVGPHPNRRINPAGADLKRLQKAPFNDVTVGSLWNLPLNSASYDAVIGLDLLNRMMFEPQALDEFLRLAKPDGIVTFDIGITDERIIADRHHGATRNKKGIIADLKALGGSGKTAVVTIRRTA